MSEEKPLVLVAGIFADPKTGKSEIVLGNENIDPISLFASVVMREMRAVLEYNAKARAPVVQRAPADFLRGHG